VLNNGADPTTVSALGVFTFATPVARNGTYSVTVQTQPAGKICTVSGGAGAGVTADIESVTVTCAVHSLSIGGTISGLGAGQRVILLNNAADPTTLAANGAFRFATPVAQGSSYSVTVASQPTGQTCTVSSGSGAGVTANVASITVHCSVNTFSIGGTMSGLAAGTQVTLFDNGADPTTLTSNGAFTFAAAVAYDSGYAVTVGTQPTGQTCTVSGGTGAGVTAAIANLRVACSTSTFTIGGTISGLAAGAQVTLSNNGADALTVTANGAFTFATPVVYEGSYAVTVGTQPIGQTCTVSGGSGAGVVADIAVVSVTCSTNTFTIGGTAAGLANGVQVTLSNNGADATTVTANGAFTFATPVAYNSSYSVTVGTQPTGQTCTVSGGSGAGVTGSISGVTVTCSTLTFLIGGAVSGLMSGGQVTLLNNGADTITRMANGAFTFATPVAYNGSYSVTVGTQPIGETCSVTGGSGAGVTAAIASVTVTCSVNTFTIGGSVDGLGIGDQVTLLNNGSDPTTVTANVAFTFATPVAFGGSYDITVSTQPTGKTCTVSGGSANGVVANVTNISVLCSTNTFSIGGTVTGLASGQQVTLYNNGGNPATVTTNSAFTFSTPVTYNGSYSVTVSTQPTGQTCTVTGGSGSGVTAAISNIAVTCSTNSFSIGGTVTGLASGQQVTLYDNGSDAATILANGAFTFSTFVVYNGSYSVTVSTNPTGQTCSVSNGTGSGVTAAISNVNVTCSTNTFTIGGSVTGLAGGQQVTLYDNGGDPATVTTNSAFTFATAVAYGGSYAVTVNTDPTGQTCTVSGGSGGPVTANVASVSVTCSTTTFTIGGTVSGLTGGQQVTLDNNGGNATTVTTNGTFTFSTPVVKNSNYAVTVGTQPNTENCTITGGSGVNVTANVTGVTVSCAAALTYSVSGTVDGLMDPSYMGTPTVTLQIEEGYTITYATYGNGTYTFLSNVPSGTVFTISISTQSTYWSCEIDNGAGPVTMDLSNVTVTCGYFPP